MWAALTGQGKKTPEPSADGDSASEYSDEGAGPSKVLKVSIGARDNGEKTWHAVNDDEHPTYIESEDFVGRVAVRVKDFKGVAPDGVARPSTPYFGTRKRIFSIQVQGRFTHDISADDLMFGGVFERKVSPPYGTWAAMKFASMIDPAIRHDLYAAQPWILSPALCAMNTVNVVPAELTWKQINERKAKGEKLTPDQILGTWEWGGEKELMEDSSNLFPEGIEMPFDHTSVSERREFFGDEETRQEILLQANKVYNLEIFAPFFNFNDFYAQLGMTLDVKPALNGQPIRLAFQSRQRTSFVCVQFELVDPPANGGSRK